VLAPFYIKDSYFSPVSSEITCNYHNLHMSSCSRTVILFILPLKVLLIEIPKRKATASRAFYIDFHRRVNLNHAITNDTFWKSAITIHDIGNLPLQFLLSLFYMPDYPLGPSTDTCISILPKLPLSSSSCQQAEVSKQ
jgi:hypothetical protein